MQLLIVNTNSSSNTRYHSEIPPGQISAERVCSNPLGRGEGARTYIRTRFREACKESKDSALTVSQWAVEYLKSSADSHLQMLYTVKWVKVCVSVCPSVFRCVCGYESMRGGFVPLDVLHHHFRASFISGRLRRPGWSSWCAAGGSCATGPGGRWSQTP